MGQVRVGVLAVQGDFAKHQEALDRIGATNLQVRAEDQLAQATHLIIPGGESTTVGLLLDRYGLGSAIRTRALAGMPIWGTCMGLILLAHEVEGRAQHTLDLLDVTVRRNAFGAQVHSFEAPVKVRGMVGEVMGVFIRAPIVTRLGAGVESLSEYNGHIVGVRSGNRIGTSFHPELTRDDRLHEWFCGI